jgi:hypothetical protein
VCVTSSAWWVGNIKCGSARTYAGVKVSTDNRQQLRLDMLQHAFQLGSRVVFSYAPFCQGGGRWYVHVGNVHALAVRQA